MKFIAFRNDAYYIKHLIGIQKDCWYLNLNSSTSTCYMVNYLKKRIFNTRKHPFMFSFKEKLILLYNLPVVSEHEVIKLLDSLHLDKKHNSNR